METINMYGAERCCLTYVEAVVMICDCHDRGEVVSLARMSDDGFELVVTGMTDEGECVLGEDNYVTLKVGQRLYLEGMVNVMLLRKEQHANLPDWVLYESLVWAGKLDDISGSYLT